ncbi:tail fiber protein [Danxiaibacter flavus]|uniref:Tail fiber protein n=1 Tax=Danxiaibacter flavus TaxID=3049108 RepID=A0ABV3ZH06_9BACT|nr:tail fiber protein [Chitinophagaceae bacterium DXS]
MEGYLAEVRMFGGTFAPRAWMFCAGQQLPISNYTALYALIGTVYGGDGVSTFNLPDLRSRVPVGTGQGLGLANYSLGMVTGTENVTLLQTQLPVHTHETTVTPGTAAATATATLNGSAPGGGGVTPAGSLLGADGNGSTVYAPAGSATTPMASASIAITNFSGPAPNVTVAAVGSSLPHNNLQPYQVINYIICTEGIFPTRN